MSSPKPSLPTTFSIKGVPLYKSGNGTKCPYVTKNATSLPQSLLNFSSSSSVLMLVFVLMLMLPLLLFDLNFFGKKLSILLFPNRLQNSSNVTGCEFLLSFGSPIAGGQMHAPSKCTSICVNGLFPPLNVSVYQLNIGTTNIRCVCFMPSSFFPGCVNTVGVHRTPTLVAASIIATNLSIESPISPCPGDHNSWFPTQ